MLGQKLSTMTFQSIDFNWPDNLTHVICLNAGCFYFSFGSFQNGRWGRGRDDPLE